MVAHRVAMAFGLAAALIVGGCRGETSPEATSTPGAPATAVVVEAGGAALYASNCARCHGADLNGTDEGPPFLHRVYEPSHHADASFFLAVQRGVRAHHWDFGDMPPVEGLSEADVAAIIAFVRAEQRAVGIE